MSRCPKCGSKSLEELWEETRKRFGPFEKFLAESPMLAASGACLGFPRDTRPLAVRLEDAAMLATPESVRENLCMEASVAVKKYVAALDEADTAFAVMNLSEMSPQARSALRDAWRMVQDALCLAKGPESNYAKAVKESREE